MEEGKKKKKAINYLVAVQLSFFGKSALNPNWESNMLSGYILSLKFLSRYKITYLIDISEKSNF